VPPEGFRTKAPLQRTSSEMAPVKIRPVIHSIGGPDGSSLRKWTPDDADVVAVFIALSIGQKGKKGTSEFYIRVATPRGLQSLIPEHGIIAVHPLLVIEKYDFDLVFRWLENTVASCESYSWLRCVEKLERYFHWEYHREYDPA